MTKAICEERCGNKDLDRLGKLVALLLKLAETGWGDWRRYAVDLKLGRHGTSQATRIVDYPFPNSSIGNGAPCPG